MDGQTKQLRDAVLILLHTMTTPDDEPALSVIRRDPQAIKQALLAVKDTDLTHYFRELILWYDLRLPSTARAGIAP